jgi:hypothetical protein
MPPSAPNSRAADAPAAAASPAAVPTLSFRALPDIAPRSTDALPAAMPSFLAQADARPLPVTVDSPASIDGGWPQPEHRGVITGRCQLADAPQGWRRDDIVGAVLKVSFEDWQGGLPLATSQQLGEYRRLTSGPSGDGNHLTVIYQRDDTESLSGEPHPATLALGGQRASAAAPRLSSLQIQGITIDRTETRPSSALGTASVSPAWPPSCASPASSASPASPASPASSASSAEGMLCFETWQTRKLLRRAHHAGMFELCIALNAEALERLRIEGEAVFFTGAEDPQYALALRRATLSVTYGQRRASEGGQEADTAVLGGLASMAGRWRVPGGSSGT